ncbi:MAG: uracil phosphoribosyltransferase [Oligoflexia bacterium]|nr:uracil phosphoribosyltransferase [Oligoflexia bacterium]
MLHDLSKTSSILSQFVSELRDVELQKERMRFRRNMERIGEIIGYELSKQLGYTKVPVQTPLAIAPSERLAEVPVLGTVLRAGLALHQGLLNFFDGADVAFVSAYRKHRADGSFEIKLEYVSCPSLSGRILVLSDPMLATGSSLVMTVKELRKQWQPSKIHIVTAIGCIPGVEHVTKELPDVDIWAAAIDPELNSKAYIVPGLGDAGDLAFGEKVQY